MTDRRPPAERVLELVVFGPAGLAVTVVEEFPKLVEKGRHRLEGRVHTARLVGQMAFQMGRRQVEQTIDRLAERHAGHAGHEVPVVDPDDVTTAAAAAGHPAATAARPVTGSAPHSAPDPAGHSAAASAPPPWPGGAVLSPSSGNGPPAVLAIPGYDSLSASQVVQRLDGLSPVELQEVRAHEAAHRHRRTILHRVEQLLAGADGVQP